jgi:hypothetical protein
MMWKQRVKPGFGKAGPFGTDAGACPSQPFAFVKARPAINAPGAIEKGGLKWRFH